MRFLFITALILGLSININSATINIQGQEEFSALPEFLKQIVDYKKSGNVEALRLYSLLACEFPGFIIKWNIEQNWENTILFIPYSSIFVSISTS